MVQGDDFYTVNNIFNWCHFDFFDCGVRSNGPFNRSASGIPISGAGQASGDAIPSLSSHSINSELRPLSSFWWWLKKFRSVRSPDFIKSKKSRGLSLKLHPKVIQEIMPLPSIEHQGKALRVAASDATRLRVSDMSAPVSGSAKRAPRPTRRSRSFLALRPKFDANSAAFFGYLRQGLQRQPTMASLREGPEYTGEWQDRR